MLRYYTWLLLHNIWAHPFPKNKNTFVSYWTERVKTNLCQPCIISAYNVYVKSIQLIGKNHCAVKQKPIFHGWIKFHGSFFCLGGCVRWSNADQKSISYNQSWVVIICKQIRKQTLHSCISQMPYLWIKSWKLIYTINHKNKAIYYRKLKVCYIIKIEIIIIII